MSQTAIRKSVFENAPVEMAHPRLVKLTLTDFRSYKRAKIEFDGRSVAIVGANGAGKTNLLEAISLLGPGRGLRRARLDELPRIDGDGGWAVSVIMNDGEDERRFGVGVEAQRPGRRICRVDDESASGPGALSDYFRFLWLTPTMDRLFMDGAGERRRFLDRMTLAIDPSHGRRSSEYEKAMRQRQRLLENSARDEEWLLGLERHMAATGVAIALARREMVKRLVSAEVAEESTIFPDADIFLQGELESALDGQSANDLESEFAENLKSRRRLDTDAGRALLGPHRSDLLVYHRPKGRPARLCSTGEQKALLIGLVLANANALAQKGGAPLILLLDEITAHLDSDRRAGLFGIVDQLGFQAFMTGTDYDLFSAWGGSAQVFEASNGILAEASLS